MIVLTVYNDKNCHKKLKVTVNSFGNENMLYTNTYHKTCSHDSPFLYHEFSHRNKKEENKLKLCPYYCLVAPHEL